MIAKIKFFYCFRKLYFENRTTDGFQNVEMHAICFFFLSFDVTFVSLSGFDQNARTALKRKDSDRARVLGHTCPGPS